MDASQEGAGHEDGQRTQSPGPLSGPGTNRQAKRLQLRKNGFRAKIVAQRKVTPRSEAMESGSRRVSSAVQSPGRPTSNLDGAGDTPEKADHHTVLREISNSSRRLKKQSRPRIDDTFSIFQDETPLPSPKAAHFNREARLDESPACATPESFGRSKGIGRHLRRSATQRRQSLNIDTAKYIEHLEAELAATQTQLSSMTSPTVTQARSHKMRALNAETRVLQDEVAQWEAKFHDRVQEEIDERNKLEAGLKARIRSLETDAEEYTQKVRDLQIQLDASVATITATESANDELEKRIGAITGIVGSPKKHEVGRFPVSPRKGHVRNKSTLPRFPTTGSLSFPFKPAETSTPLTPHPNFSASMPPPRIDSGLDLSPMQQDLALASLDTNALEQAAALSDSASSACSSKRFSWSTPDSQASVEPAVPASTGKPCRRMRRFHATNMPKPLLLPSTASSLHYVPASAPPLESHQTPPSFPFPDLPEVSELPPAQDFGFLLSPALGHSRRRAMTSADGMNLAMRRMSAQYLAASTPGSSSTPGGALLPSPLSASAEETPRDFSSLGSTVGRNLFEELQRAKNVDSVESDSQRNISGASDATERPSKIGSSRSTSLHTADLGCHGVRRRAWTSHQRSVSEQTGLARNAAQNDTTDITGRPARSSVMNYFADLWRQSFFTARRCLVYAQSVTIRSASVQKLQWFLIELFLGPQVARRIMASSMRRRDRSGSLLQLRDMALTPTHTRGRSALDLELEAFSTEALQRVERPLTDGNNGQVFWSRHSPWLWIRFSLTLVFAFGAAIRDGPGAVLGIEDRIM